MNVYSFIDEIELSKLIVEIINTADNINGVLSRYDDNFSKLKNSYEGKPYNDLNEFYNTYVRPNFLIIKKNIVSYSDDLSSLIRKMHENNQDLTKLFNQYTTELVSIKKNQVDNLK